MPTSPTSITALPNAPSRADPANFAARADAFLLALGTFGTQTNAVGSVTYANAVEALDSASAAQASATASAASSNDATNSKNEAEASANAALSIYDQFNAQYLGSKIADPSLNNDGGALLTGALYWNSTANEIRVYNGSVWQVAYVSDTGYLLRSGGVMNGDIDLSNNSLTAIKNATFNTQGIISTTSGSITVDWTVAQNQLQAEPTGTITYTFTAPAGPCHLQLIINSDGTSTAQTINWPGGVIQYGQPWAGANNKRAVINFWYDGSSYHMIGTNQV